MTPIRLNCTISTLFLCHFCTQCYILYLWLNILYYVDQFSTLGPVGCDCDKMKISAFMGAKMLLRQCWISKLVRWNRLRSGKVILIWANFMVFWSCHMMGLLYNYDLFSSHTSQRCLPKLKFGWCHMLLSQWSNLDQFWPKTTENDFFCPINI